MGAFVKMAGQSMTSVNIVFYRNVVGLIFILSTIIRNPLQNKGKRFGLLMFRGLIGSLALFALFYNMSHIGLGEAITYIQTSTIWVAVLSFLFLREKLSIWGWLAVFAGFIGILFVFQPNFNGDSKTDLLGIFNGLAAGAAYTSVRELKKHYDTRSIVLSFMSWGTLLSLLLMVLAPRIHAPNMDFLFTPFQWPQGSTWLWVILVGITAMLGQIFITKAYGFDKAGIVSTVGYTNIPFAIFIGFLLGDRFPDVYTIIGMLMIIGSGIVIAIRRNY
ncbi:MAG: EamA family transporter [Bacteroidetes bacterium]|nr:EamA family transporter [Bacteroidota bacterium]